jgi:N-acetyl-1-D-myo-inositol-2-amino-2-deoxy-alpha-D-glucopyranoside deacetylase
VTSSDLEPIGHASRERILFVHAHPDDETIATGGTIAVLLDAGAEVTVVTCTRGERGEVVPPELRHLEGDGPALAEHRARELAGALHVLGVTDHRFLGEPGARAGGAAPRRYLDSGMVWGPNGAEAAPDADPASFAAADLVEVVGDLAEVIAAVRPTAVVSYDETGGYGHPDHVRAHEAASSAALLRRTPFFEIVPRGRELESDRVVDIAPVLDRKVRALEAYRTQLTVAGDTIVHSGGQVEPILTTEVFRTAGDEEYPGLAWSELGLAGRILACLLAFMTGVIAGVIGTVGHRLALAIVSLGIAAALLVGLRLAFGTRLVAGCAAIGLLLASGVLALAGPGGSILVKADAPGLIWAYGPSALVVLVLAWPRSWAALRDTMRRKSAQGEDVDSP